MSKVQIKILFSIITYRPNPQQLKKLLKVLKPYQVLIVDNTKKNLGYAGGANKVFLYGLKQKVDWVVILNQDLTIAPAFLQKFVSLLKTSKPGVLGPFVGSLDKKRWTASVILGSSSLENDSRIDSGQARMTRRTDYISGSFLAIHRKVIEKVGPFYEPYFLYYEEVDYCQRAQKAGFPLLGISSVGLKHGDVTSLGRGSYLHEYYLARNHLLFVERCAPFYIKLRELLHLPLTLYRHYQNKNTGALAGVKDYLSRRFGKYQ